MGGSSGIGIIDQINPLHTEGAVGNAVNQVAGPNTYVGQTLDATGKVALSPFEAAYHVARGDIQHAGNTVMEGVGSAAYLGMGPTQSFFQSNYGQETLKSIPGGHGGPLAGTSRAIYDLQYKGETSQSNWNDVGRFAAQGTALAAGGLLFSGQGGAAAAAVKPGAGVIPKLPTLTMPEIGAGAGAWLTDQWNRRNQGGDSPRVEVLPPSAPDADGSGLVVIGVAVAILAKVL